MNEARVKTLDAVANWLAMLPNQKISDLLAGALLRVRRDLFDQAPSASPVQETTTSAGQIIGTVGAIDPEDDPLAYSVVANPQFGTVELTEDGQYTYTPGADYAGADSFTVRIGDTNGGHNRLTRNDLSTEVQIQVGAQASDDPFLANNLNDAALLLKNSAATISVDRKMGRLVGSVAMNLPDDTALLWLDEQGRTGLISVAEVAAHWDGIQNAGKVMLGIDYTLEDGTEATMILKSVQATYEGAGQYVFNGALAPDAHDGAGVNSFWDVIGNEYKASYENFRQQNGLDGIGFRSLTLNVNGASVYLDTFSVHDYEQALEGTDPGTPVNDPNAAVGGAATRLRNLVANSTAVVTDGVTVTAMLPYGSSLIVGQSDGSVEEWDGQSFTQLKAPGAWYGAKYSTDYPNSAFKVKTIVPYQTGFVVGLENGAVEQWDGAQWKELKSYSVTPDSQVLNTMLSYQSGFVVGMIGPNGGVQQWTGTAWNKLAGYNTIAEWGSEISTIAPYKTGFVVGLAAGGISDAGAVKYWNGTGWQELQGATGSAVTAMTTDNGDLVVGRSSGAVEKWDGTGWAPLSGPGSAVTVMLVDPLGSLVVGRADGSVQRNEYDPSCYSNCRKSLTTRLSSGGVNFGGNLLGDKLDAGQQLGVGDWLASPNGAYTLGLQQDGNLVLAARGQAVWASGTYGKNVDRAVLQPDGNFVLYKGSTSVWSSGTAGAQNAKLTIQDDRNAVIYNGNSAPVWNSGTYTTGAPPTAYAVTALLAYGDSFVASFADGSVKQGGVDYGSGQPKFRWIDMASKGSAGVTAMAPYSVPPSTTGSDGFYLGLDNGVVKRYGKWSNKWFEMRALPAPGSFSGDTLEKAVKFALTEGATVAGTGDPLFGTSGLKSYQPLCLSNNTCGSGTIYTFNISKEPASLASKSIAFADPSQSVDFSYDLGTTGYGYVFVPGGVWNKLDMDQYSFGVLLAVTTGPSLNLNLGSGCVDNTCTLKAAETQLASLSWTTPPSPYGNITLTGDVSAKLDVALGLPAGSNTNKLTASAYLTGGVVLAYNTPEAFWNSGWNYYYKTDVSDFTNLDSVSLIPTLTPSITGSWGYTVPNVPILGTVSLASVSLTYSNPVDLNLTLAKGSSPSLTLGSSGTLGFSAGFVPDLTSSLTYSTTFPLYDVRTGNLLAV